MRIKEIILFTSNIENQKQFYRDVLDFELVFDTEDFISFNTGSSILSFQYRNSNTPTHIAFNIPSNKIEDALEWLQKRVEILPDGEAIISNFKSWNAQAIYFYDADNNIIEFIARENLEVISNDAFSSKSILSISEMALVTIDIKKVYGIINSMKSISIFDGNLERFCALGNDEGLFIVINKNLKTWHPTQEEAFVSDFIIKGDYNFSYSNGEIQTI